MNLSVISDESRADQERAQRTPMPPPLCDCLESDELCAECREKLAGYDNLASDLRSLSHVVAGVLGSFGQQMPVVARGKLRAAFTEYSLPHLPDWGDRFWEIMADVVQDELNETRGNAKEKGTI